MSQLASAQNEVRIGVIASVGASVMWGVLPIYLKAVGFADSLEVLAERVLFSVPTAVIAILLVSGAAKGLREMAGALNPRMLGTLALSSLLIFFNWGVYVWAVANQHVMEAALAYFLSPLLQVVIGAVFFKETLSAGRKIALVLAGAGVLVQGVALGAPPWISLALCASWIGYAIVRKQAPVPAATGMLIETIILAPLAIGLLIWLSRTSNLTIDDSAGNAFLLALSGPATVAPLILFAISARRISFALLGILQYIAPSLQFLAGVFYGEPLTALRMLSFALIWAGLIAFTLDSLRAHRAAKPVQIEA